MPMSAKSAKRPKQLKITYTAKAPFWSLIPDGAFLRLMGKNEKSIDFCPLPCYHKNNGRSFLLQNTCKGDIAMLTIGELIEGFKKGFELLKKLFAFFKPLFGKDNDETSGNA